MATRRIELNDDTVRVVNETDVVWSVAWVRINKVVAYKADLFAVDLIVIQLVDATGLAHELDEEMSGYHNFLRELPNRFPGIREDWWREVAFPAFCPNTTELWSRAG